MFSRRWSGRWWGRRWRCGRIKRIGRFWIRGIRLNFRLGSWHGRSSGDKRKRKRRKSDWVGRLIRWRRFELKPLAVEDSWEKTRTRLLTGGVSIVLSS